MSETDESQGQEVVYRAEEALVDEMLVSSTPGELVRQYLGLPENVSGLTIVDVAAGFSSLTANLIAEGAVVHAVDPRFEGGEVDIGQLIQNVFFNTMRHLQYYPNRAYFETSLSKSLLAFKDSFLKDRQRYHAEYATRLPFPDNFSDYTVSSNGLSLLLKEPDVMLGAIKKALQVTKPGGKTILFPWFPEGQHYIEENVDIHERVATKIQMAGLGIPTLEGPITIQSPIYHNPEFRLSILKPL